MSITSKLYNKFLELKSSDENKIYLFKTGIFYISLNEDAKQLSDIFGFKITNLNDEVIKCGFPQKRINYYSSLLKKLDIDFELIENKTPNSSLHSLSLKPENFETIINQLISIDFDNITFKQAFDTLYELSSKTKDIINQEKF